MGRCEVALDVERVSTAAWVDKNFSAEPALLKLLLRATSIVAIRNDCSTPIRNVALKVSNARPFGEGAADASDRPKAEVATQFRYWKTHPIAAVHGALDGPARLSHLL
jgi:hypothetical protein